ncbi:hypothetical protein [Aureivirga sp. CE67]|uniref:hypothetical protein n=1 Tax=Aureivirga sp. CE67 TaxID=1788983 RepID=UPI0018CB364D|nr:hypothetical protein [Aureivirga sp. CE67]
MKLKRVLLIALMCAFYQLSAQVNVSVGVGVEAPRMRVTGPDTNGLTENASYTTNFVSPIVKDENYYVITEKLNTYWVKQYSIENEFIKEHKIPYENFDHTNLMGGLFNKGEMFFYFSNNSRSGFTIRSMEMNTGNSKEIKISLEFEKQNFVDFIVKGESVYLVFIEKKSSILNFYKFEGTENTGKHVVDLSKYKFKESKYSNKLYDILKNDKIAQISSNNITLIEEAAKKNKTYVNQDSYFIVMDASEKNTKCIEIDLNDFSFELKMFFKKGKDYKSSKKYKSNSFINNNLLFQIICSRKEMYISIFDVSTKELLKQFHVGENQDIDFNVTDFEQIKYLKKEKKKTWSETDKFLKKMKSGAVAISVFEYQENYYIEIGGIPNTKSKGILSEIGLENFKENSEILPSYCKYTGLTEYSFKSILNKNTLEFKKERTKDFKKFDEKINQLASRGYKRDNIIFRDGDKIKIYYYKEKLDKDVLEDAGLKK